MLEVEKIDKNKKISPMTIPESHATALKAIAKIPADIDHKTGTAFFSAIMRKGGFSRELNLVSETLYPLLMDGLKLCILDKKKPGALSDLELRFALGLRDLTKWANAKGEIVSQESFLAGVMIVLECTHYSNFPNMLKKRDKVAGLFTPELLTKAETALLSTAYLGADPSGRYYFTPSEFRLYWALHLALLEHTPERYEKLADMLDQKNLVLNKSEFHETRTRIRR